MEVCTLFPPEFNIHTHTPSRGRPQKCSLQEKKKATVFQGEIVITIKLQLISIRYMICMGEIFCHYILVGTPLVLISASDLTTGEKECQSLSPGPQSWRTATDCNRTAISMCWRSDEDEYLASQCVCVCECVCTQAYTIQYPHTTPHMNMQAGERWMIEKVWMK